MINVNNLINNLPYVMQNNPYGATATVVAANILSMEIALRIVKFMFKIFDKYLDYSDLSNLVATGMVITILSASTAGTNFALNKLLKLPFNPWVTAGLSTLTGISYASIRIANMKPLD